MFTKFKERMELTKTSLINQNHFLSIFDYITLNTLKVTEDFILKIPIS